MSIDIIKNDFETIKDFKLQAENLLKRMRVRIVNLKDIYNDYLTKHDDSDLVLTLDSFHFQTKFIEIECDNYTNMFNMFINRLYGDYYKFYKYIYSNIIEHIQLFSIKINNKFPVYKDLINENYNFTHTVEIHTEIIKIVNELQSYLLTLEHENNTDKTYSSYGINIDNLVTVNNYKNIVLSEKIKLIIDCLNSYSDFQSKFLESFVLKIKFITAQITADIRIENSDVVEKKIDEEILISLESPNKKKVIKLLNENKTPSNSDSEIESCNSDKESELSEKYLNNYKSSNPSQEMSIVPRNNFIYNILNMLCKLFY